MAGHADMPIRPQIPDALKEYQELLEERNRLQTRLTLEGLRKENDHLAEELKRLKRPASPKMSEASPKSENSISKTAKPGLDATQEALTKLQKQMDELMEGLADVKKVAEAKLAPAASQLPAPEPPKPTEEPKEEEPKKAKRMNEYTSYEDYPPEERAPARARDNPHRDGPGPTVIKREKVYHHLRGKGVSEARAREVSEVKYGGERWR